MSTLAVILIGWVVFSVPFGMIVGRFLAAGDPERDA